MRYEIRRTSACQSVDLSHGGFVDHLNGPRGLLRNIVDLLVPELQRPGRFRSAYTGRTLRENLAS